MALFASSCAALRRAAPRGVALARGFAAAASEEPLHKTALYDLHVELGGKMVPFAGYALPVQYPDGVLKSHLHTRDANGASLFDVGHMGQLRWHGKDRAAFLERVCTADVTGLKEGASTLTLLTLPSGGILDDSILSNHGAFHYHVVNGATKAKDMAHFDALLRSPEWAGKDVKYEYLATQNLVALQGPAAEEVLVGLVEGGDKERVRNLPFMHGTSSMKVAGVTCSVVRCGYTGEDGFEIGMAPEHAVKVATAILGDARAKPAALGPRDSLRLEAGLCLYGHDIDETTTPNEAALIWTVGKARRDAGRDTFLGADVILKELKAKSWKRRRVGLAVNGAPAREGAKIYAKPANGSTDPAAAGAPIGVVTSGTFSPCLKAPIAMGYVPPTLAAEGSAVAIEVRGKLVPATVAKMPFVPNRYKRV